MTESLLEVLRSEDLQANTEAFLYCMGTIKFISGNSEFLHEMIGKGAVEILMNLIKQVNENTKKSGTCLPNSGHLLVQVSILLESIRLVKLIFMLSNITELPGGCNRWAVIHPRWGVLGLGAQGGSPSPTSTLCACFLWKSYSVAFYMELSTCWSRSPARGQLLLLPCRKSRPEE